MRALALQAVGKAQSYSMIHWEEAFEWTQAVLVSEFSKACRLVEDGDGEVVYGHKDECKVRGPLRTAGDLFLG